MFLASVSQAGSGTMSIEPDAATPPAPPPAPALASAASPEPERLARAAISRLAEPNDAEMQAALVARPAAEVWDALRAGGDGLPAALVARTAARAATVRPGRDLDRIAALGGRLVVPGDDEWPATLGELDQPPYALWVRGAGDLAALTRRSVSVVGARAATAYGVHVAGELAAGLGQRGWSTVSGGAYGIDGAAHRGSLAAGAGTVAVLACGVDVAYPSGHVALFARVVESGLLVSEWPPGCSPMRHRFLTRNRVIAALTGGTVVVEAALRSGARRTANEAVTLGRPVMAVPGPVTSALSAGCHLLLRDGAVCVTGAADVVAQLGPLDPELEPAGGPATPRDDLGPFARRVLDATPRARPAPVERIAATSGLAVLDVARVLAQLAAHGLVVGQAGRYRLAPAALADPG